VKKLAHEHVGKGGGEILVSLLGKMKALYWFHWTSHWQTIGAPFYGDHELFARLKDDMVDEIDTLAEKLVGYYGADSVDPWHVMEHEHAGMAPEYATDLVSQALLMEQSFQADLQQAYDKLKASGEITLGLDDFIMGLSSDHDSHVYLLQQRMGGKGTFGAVASTEAFNSLEKSWSGHSSFRPTRHAEDDWSEWMDAGLMTEES